MAARSFEPAKRCERPQSFKASDAGRWWLKISSRISIAAATLPPGVIRSNGSEGRREKNADRENEPHDEEDHEAEEKGHAARLMIIRRGENKGMPQARQNEEPFHDDEEEIGFPRQVGENHQNEEKRRQLGLVAA